jgi:MFS family permease
VISLHIVGMYALVLVIGRLVDRLGRRPGEVAGLLLMAASTLVLAWFESVFWMSASLFLLGLGWNVSYVAAVTELADRALPAERGRLIGLTDGVSSAAAVVFVLVGGLVYSELGVEALAFGATASVILPAAWILLRSAAGAPDARLLSDEDLQRQAG